MSATVASPSHSQDHSWLEQRHPLPDPLPDFPLTSADEQIGTTSDTEENNTAVPESLDAPEEDVMDHEPSLSPAAAIIPPNFDLHHDPMVVDTSWTASETLEEQATISGNSHDQTASAILAAEPIAVAPEPPANPTTTSQSISQSLPRNDNPQQEANGHVEVLDPPQPPVSAESADDPMDPDTESSMVEEDERDDDDYDSDESFLAEIVEDTSTPSQEELERMERMKQSSATDHQFWERQTYKILEDPEFRPNASHRFHWELEGFRGTRDVPNKKRIMRSQVVEVGGFQWNIKLFPRGNGGTDHVSVYVECTGPVVSETSSAFKEHVKIQTTEKQSEKDADLARATITPKWEVSAQIGCVMYNPKEPRVCKFEHDSHQFHNNSQDWGWTRFYGPWTTLHARRRDQHKPMLQDDKLAFTVYIQTFVDPTRALFWRHTEGSIWNSLERTGLRGFEVEGTARYALTAALAPWFHLLPFKKLLTEASAPLWALEPCRQSQPLIHALHSALYLKQQNSWTTCCLEDIGPTLRWYGDVLSESSDVIQVWENLRAILNLEFGRMGNNPGSQQDVLSFIRVIKAKYEPQEPGQTSAFRIKKPQTSQDIVDEISRDDQTGYQEWEGFKSPGIQLPPVLQIELHRQRYDHVARGWKRLTHKVKITDSVVVSGTLYRLFGLVISKGKLGSGKTYSIVRSSHINSQWARYKSGVVSYVTRRQAIDAHEGHDPPKSEQDSVAQVLIYIREDSLADILSSDTPKAVDCEVAPLSMPQCMSSALEPPKIVSVVIHWATEFVGYEGPGILNMEPGAQADQTAHHIHGHFPSDSTLDDIEDYINKEHLTEGLHQHVICSQIDWSAGPRFMSPRIRRNKAAKLQSLQGFPHVHIWARIYDEQTSPKSCDASEQQTKETPSAKEVFLKVFDPSRPSAVGLGSFVAPDATLREAIGSNLPVGDLIICREAVDEYSLRESEITLDTKLSSPSISNGDILVLIPAELENDAAYSVTSSLNPVQEYYQRARNVRRWSFQSDTYHKAYYGGPYLHAQLKDSLITGHGTSVATCGDYYTGSFCNSFKHGEGTMYYAGSNGDTYTGSWHVEQRSGHGKMEYGQTGNVYLGEWREGRRHGSGTMTYQQADEQLQVCHICYGNEIDALFYRCGHILACESCARLCHECPVCRRPVDAVVKIYDMRQVGV